MDKHPQKRNREPAAPFSSNVTGQDSAAPASHFFLTGEADQIQPFDGTGFGSKSWGNFFASVRASCTFEYGKLPPISAFINKLPLGQGESAEVRSSDGGVRSETLPSGSPVSAMKWPAAGEEIGLFPLDKSETIAAGEPLNPHPVHLTPTSPRPGGDGPIISFTDPDYEFHPRRKKSRGCLSSEQGAQQEAGQEPGVSFFVSQAMPPAQCQLLGPTMCTHPFIMPYRVGYYYYPSFCQYHPVGIYSRLQTCCSRDSMEEVKTYHNTHLQSDETVQATLAREHHPADPHWLYHITEETRAA